MTTLSFSLFKHNYGLNEYLDPSIRGLCFIMRPVRLQPRSDWLAATDGGALIGRAPAAPLSFYHWPLSGCHSAIVPHNVGTA